MYLRHNKYIWFDAQHHYVQIFHTEFRLIRKINVEGADVNSLTLLRMAFSLLQFSRNSKYPIKMLWITFLYQILSK